MIRIALTVVLLIAIDGTSAQITQDSPSAVRESRGWPSVGAGLRQWSKFYLGISPDAGTPTNAEAIYTGPSVDEEWTIAWLRNQRERSTQMDRLFAAKQAIIALQIKNHANRAHSAEACAALNAAFHKWDQHGNCVGEDAILAAEAASSIEGTSSQKLQRSRKYSFDRLTSEAKRLHNGSRPRSRWSGITGPMFNLGRFAAVAVTVPFATAGYIGASAFTNAPASRGVVSTLRLARQVYLPRFRDIEVTGDENLKVDSSTVRLFLVSHRNALGDALLCSAIPVNEAIIFGNARVIGTSIHPWIGNRLGQLVASIPELAAVGDCKGRSGLPPLEQLMSGLEQGASSSVLNFPQGFVSDFGEVGATHPEIADKLVRPLLEWCESHDRELVIIPVSYEIQSEFLDSKLNFEGENPAVHISPGIDHRAIREILRIQATEGNERLLENILRGVWLDNINRHKELSWDELGSRLSANIGMELHKPDRYVESKHSPQNSQSVTIEPERRDDGNQLSPDEYPNPVVVRRWEISRLRPTGSARDDGSQYYLT